MKPNQIDTSLCSFASQRFQKEHANLRATERGTDGVSREVILKLLNFGEEKYRLRTDLHTLVTLGFIQSLPR